MVNPSLSKMNWDTFFHYTAQYARRILFYLPFPLLFIFLVLDYLPKWRILDFKQFIRTSSSLILFSVIIAFLIFTLARLVILIFGSQEFHQKMQHSWRFHAVLQGLCFGVVILLFEYLWPHVNLHALPFSKLFPNTFFALPLIAFVIFFSLRSFYSDNSYKELKRTAAEAEYRTLKAQMQPHFLFNSINNLVELIETDSERARDMAQKLADLYREILKNSKNPTSTLRSEISIVRNYLELSKIRFQDRLSFEFKVPKEAEGIYVPSLILQTLVENCIKHGVAKSTEACYIHLEVWKELDAYHFQITNSGEPYKANAKMGTGLTNTVERLKLFGEQRSQFHIEAMPEGTKVKFTIPEVSHG